MIDQHVAIYNQTIQKIEKDASERERNVSSAVDALQKHIALFQSKGIFAKVWGYLPYKTLKTAIQKGIDENRKLLASKPTFRQEALELLVVESARQLMLSGQQNQELLRLEEQHALLRKIYAEAAEIECEAQAAISEVDSALSSLSSAQSMEVMDMMTKNKGISMMSTMQNFSASDAVSQASDAVQRFQSQLEQHQRKWRELKHDTSIETTDFMFDMFLDSGMLDMVGSIFSMMALSSAESNLRKVRAGLSELADKLSLEVRAYRDNLKAHETLLLSFKTEQRRLILPMLLERGISVPEDVISRISKLYAPSAGV